MRSVHEIVQDMQAAHSRLVIADHEILLGTDAETQCRANDSMKSLEEELGKHKGGEMKLFTFIPPDPKAKKGVSMAGSV